LKQSAPMLWVFRKIRKRIPAIVLLTVSNIVYAFLGVMFALTSSDVVDTAVAGDTQAFIRACIVQACVIAGILLSLTFNRYWKEKLTVELDRHWKQDLLHGLLHGEYAQVSAYHTGELLNRLNNDVRTLTNNLLTTIPSLASMLTKLIGALVVLIAMEPLFSLIIVAAGVVVLLLTGLMRRRIKGLHKQVSQEDGRVSGFLQETLEKLLMVQAMDVAQEMETRAGRFIDRWDRIQRKRRNVTLLANTCVSVLSYGASFGALVWCAGSLLTGSMSFGTLVAVSQLVSQLQTPFLNLSGIIPQYIAMLACAERLMELEQVSAEPAPGLKDVKATYESVNAICAQDLCFSYDRDPVFQNASFTLPKGEFGVIMGHSGIGKSTLLKLVLGIFHPESGQLYLQTADGAIPLDRSTRRLFAYVPQGNLLISGTVRENLIITRPQATEEEIRQAVHISGMDDFLPSLPHGLDTVLGESAAGLSEGQAQRLRIARAVLSQAPILLLDEATSALDADTEALVLQRLQQAGKTCIAVTHRPAAIAMSNWCLEMKEGRCILTRL